MFRDVLGDLVTMPIPLPPPRRSPVRRSPDGGRYPTATAGPHRADRISTCRACPGMNEPEVTPSAPGYGAAHSPVAIVGQSLCRKCIESGIPFTGGSGKYIGRRPGNRPPREARAVHHQRRALPPT